MKSQIQRAQSFLNRNSKAIVAFFFLSLLLLGFATVDDYGQTWDDVGEINILRMALKEYANMLPFENQYTHQLKDVIPISESIERDHGICLYYPMFWAVLQSNWGVAQTLTAWRCYTWLLFCIGLFALYAVARRMGFSCKLSLLCVGMVLLSPRFFAEGHYNNKDIPLMCMVLMLLWQTARLMEKPNWTRGATFALTAGFCAGTRVIGVAFCGLFGLMTVLHLWQSKRLNHRTLGVGAFLFAAAVMVYCLLTPSFLSDPLAFVEYLVTNAVSFSRWNGWVLFFGEVIPCAITKPTRFYLPAMIILTTPLWALVLLGIGCVLGRKTLLNRRKKLLMSTTDTVCCTTLLAWILQLVGLVAIRTLVYNGWRHVYFLYGPMVLTMGMGIQLLWRKWANRLLFRRLLCILLVGSMVFTCIGIVANHPYQFCYYNALVPTKNRAALFDLDYWNLSATQAVEQLLCKHKGNCSVLASDRYSRSGLAMACTYLDTERVEVLPMTAEIAEADYVISNLSYARIFDFEPGERLEPVITISAYGSPITVIYRVKEKELP